MASLAAPLTLHPPPLAVTSRRAPTGATPLQNLVGTLNSRKRRSLTSVPQTGSNHAPATALQTASSENNFKKSFDLKTSFNFKTSFKAPQFFFFKSLRHFYLVAAERMSECLLFLKT